MLDRRRVLLGGAALAALARAARGQTLSYASPTGGGSAPSGPFMLVATSTYIPNTLSSAASGNAMMTRKAHFCRDNVTSMKLVYPGYWVTSLNGATAGPGDERAMTAGTTVSGWIEYPLGTYTPVTFASATSTSLATGANIVSDAAAVTIPNGAQFWTWTYQSGGSGALAYTGGLTGLMGGTNEGSKIATSGVPSSPTASPGFNSTSQGLMPCAILAVTTAPSVMIFGDSRTAGVADSFSSSLDRGDAARTIGAGGFAYINGGVSGDWGVTLLGGWNRMGLAAYCTNVVMQSGFNDINNNSATAANDFTLAQRFAKRFGLVPFVRATFEPQTTSTDSFATTANQTPTAAGVVVGTYNGLVAADTVPYLDLSLAASSAANSNKWAVPSETSDGTHPNVAGNQLMETNGIAAGWSGIVTASHALSPSYSSSFTPSSATYAAGPTGWGQVMTGGSGVVPAAVMPGAAPYTLECRINVASAPGSMAVACGSQSWAYIYTDASGFAKADYNFGGTLATVAGNTNVCDGAWHHIAVVMQASGATIYVDGVAEGTNASAPIKQNLSFLMGIRCFEHFGSRDFVFTGSLDEVASWNFAKYTGNFTPPTGPYAGTEAGLSFVWHLDGNATGVNGPAL